MIKRGDIFFADLSPVVGSEQGGTRPVLVIQNNLGNHFSPTVIIAAITAKTFKNKLPTHIRISSNKSGITKDSVVLLEQIRTIDKSRLREKICQLDTENMNQVNQAICVSLGLYLSETKKKIT
ncbi:type II toxin-antitoxin system PemK/MazF family toxin [Vagococcus entomophilus]|uniref:mRNA interferase n=1 Tax=Vagococcus entomophilus TaxID=1160095 RepID=A0A430AFT1_9ENTE|nr:type II toxin-antitoxin system PemK/MazF family toxin [Vagococcus entomophilus]RSU06597.1 PemK family transcriptional regulator [Vagococcus entomophilus]